MMIPVISQPPARFVDGDTPQPQQRERRAGFRDDGGDRDEEVLGEQLAARKGEGDEADREGQFAEHLALRGVLDQQ